MLHLEYDYEEGLLKNIADQEVILQKIKEISDPEINRKTSEKLSLSSLKEKEKSAEMWKTVFKLINSK